ncbi:MAG: sensor histidine kinase [Betaproteobacteria bacterium]|nr:sensor histidine kinase [Betaproteobacteria bacterium]
MSAPRLERRLLRWLLPPLAAVLVGSAVLDGYLSRRPVTAAFDQQLLVIALAITPQVELVAGYPVLHMPPAAEQVLRDVGGSDLRFGLYDQNGRRFAGAGQLPPLASQTSPRATYFEVTESDVRLRGVRIGQTVAGRPVAVVVAVPRERLERRIEEAIVPGIATDVVIVVLTLVLVLLGVRRGLEPLADLRDELARRSPKDLQPLSTTGLPIELVGLADTLNRLFGAVREAEAVQQRFIADAAHQLRTPLAGLQTRLQVLALEPGARLDPDSLGDLQTALGRISHLLSQLLALARAEPAAMRPNQPEPLDLAEVVTACASPFVDRALESGIDLGYEAAAAPVDGVRALLIEALSNLIDNALRYCPRGSRVTVRCDTGPTGSAWLEVEDDGPGIPVAERERVFERFYRIRDDVGEGCGLGLAIVREVLQRHAASISLDDAAPGRGLRVRIEFPTPV